jgi:general nucleoside transport system ATP-binding protein
VSRPLLEVRGVTKRFGPVIALRDGDLVLRAGRVTAIVGENGAGKSTLAKIVAGVYPPDVGAIAFDGRPGQFGSRRRMAAFGVGFVPQTLSFVGALSALDNHMLAASSFVLARKPARAAIARAGASLGVDLDWDVASERLSLAERQLAEIASVLAHGARILLLDEPTSALGPIDIERLIAALVRLKERDVAIGLVTHRVREVIEAADDVVVLRRGEVVHSSPVTGLNGEGIARLMVGSRPREFAAPQRPRYGPDRLVAENLSVAGALDRVSFRVRAGEIVGVAGIAGKAQPALAESLAGLRGEAQGRVFLDGREITRAPALARKLGLAFVPEARSDGAPAELPVSLAASLLRLGQSGFTRFGLRCPSAERALFLRIADRFDVRPPDPALRVTALSGGNQQKLLIGRELERRPHVLIAHGPTQGLDLAAAAAVRLDIAAAAAAGAAVLVISTDLDELIELSSRILVLAQGRLSAEFDGSTASADLAHRIGESMTGAADRREAAA